MTIDRGAVERIARLARLHLEPDEMDDMRAAMDVCLEHFEELSRVDASPLITANPAPSAPRPDAEDPDPLHVPLAENAPDWRDDLFIVPRLPAMDEDD